MAIDTARYAALRDQRKNATLTKEESDEWRVISAQIRVEKAKKQLQLEIGRASKRQAVKEIELGRLVIKTGVNFDNAEQFTRTVHLGMLADQAGLADLPDERLRRAFIYCAERVQKEREAEAAAASDDNPAVTP